MSPSQTNSRRDEVVANGDGSWKWPLKAHPFFWGFRDAELYGEGGSAFLQANPHVLWYALSHGIPAESFAAGANPVPKWNQPCQSEGCGQTDSGKDPMRNVDMATDCNPAGPGKDAVNWIHSYFIENSLFDTNVLFDKLAKEIGSTKPYILDQKENQDE